MDENLPTTNQLNQLIKTKMCKKEKAFIYHQRIFLQFIYAGGSIFGIELGTKVVNQISAATIIACRKPGTPQKNYIISQFVNTVRWKQVFKDE